MKYRQPRQLNDKDNNNNDDNDDLTTNVKEKLEGKKQTQGNDGGNGSRSEAIGYCCRWLQEALKGGDCREWLVRVIGEGGVWLELVEEMVAGGVCKGSGLCMVVKGRLVFVCRRGLLDAVEEDG